MRPEKIGTVFVMEGRRRAEWVRSLTKWYTSSSSSLGSLK
jgi:hypothetical protein